MTARDRARVAVRSIIVDLLGRRGLRCEWANIDEDVKDEIAGTWTVAVEVSISAAIADERAACAAIAESVAVAGFELAKAMDEAGVTTEDETYAAMTADEIARRIRAREAP